MLTRYRLGPTMITFVVVLISLALSTPMSAASGDQSASGVTDSRDPLAWNRVDLGSQKSDLYDLTYALMGDSSLSSIVFCRSVVIPGDDIMLYAVAAGSEIRFGRISFSGYDSAGLYLIEEWRTYPASMAAPLASALDSPATYLASLLSYLDEQSYIVSETYRLPNDGTWLAFGLLGRRGLALRIAGLDDGDTIGALEVSCMSITRTSSTSEMLAAKAGSQQTASPAPTLTHTPLGSRQSATDAAQPGSSAPTGQGNEEHSAAGVGAGAAAVGAEAVAAPAEADTKTARTNTVAGVGTETTPAGAEALGTAADEGSIPTGETSSGPVDTVMRFMAGVMVDKDPEEASAEWSPRLNKDAVRQVVEAEVEFFRPKKPDDMRRLLNALTLSANYVSNTEAVVSLVDGEQTSPLARLEIIDGRWYLIGLGYHLNPDLSISDGWRKAAGF